MRIIIEHGHTKREMFGAFSICGSRDDLLNLARTIIGECSRDEDRPFGYGWVQIRPLSEANASVANTPPISWEAKGAPSEETR